MNTPSFVPPESDADAGVWVATSDDVPGLIAEAETIEALDFKLKCMVPELLRPLRAAKCSLVRHGTGIALQGRSRPMALATRPTTPRQLRAQDLA